MQRYTQFAGETFTGVLKAAEVDISMDGKARAMDNIMVDPRATPRWPGPYFRVLRPNDG